jgi:antitoxin (DNA-binding transcriptional repressor) of toxin-antitoxin stability system
MLTLLPGDQVQVFITHRGVPYAKTLPITAERDGLTTTRTLALHLVLDIADDLAETPLLKETLPE